MCRTLTLALVPALLMVTWGEARAERVLYFDGSVVSGPITVYIGAQTVGSQTITTILGPVTLQNGETKYSLRDKLVSEVGVPNVGKRAAEKASGYPGIQVFHGDNVQFWVSLDQTNWQLLVAGNLNGVVLNGVTFIDKGSNAPTAAAGGVPAIGGVGLAMMVVAMLAAGGYILKRRQTASAA